MQNESWDTLVSYLWSLIGYYDNHMTPASPTKITIWSTDSPCSFTCRWLCCIVCNYRFTLVPIVSRLDRWLAIQQCNYQDFHVTPNAIWFHIIEKQNILIPHWPRNARNDEIRGVLHRFQKLPCGVYLLLTSFAIIGYGKRPKWIWTWNRRWQS